MRQFYIVLAMLFALSTGLILPNQQETLRSKRSLIGGIIGGNGNAGGGIGGSIGIGGGGGIGGIIGGAGDIAGGIINGIAGVLQGLGEMAGGLAGSIGDISGNIGAIAQGGININAQAQLSLSLSVVNSQCDNTIKLINQLPASLTQAQLAKVNSVVVVLVKLRASLVAARQRVVSISADKNAQLIGEIDVSIGKVDSTIATIKNKVPSVTVPTQVDEGSSSNDGGNESSGSVDIGSIIAGAGSAGLDTSVIQQIATSIKIIVQSSSDIAASGSASADTQQKLTAALSNLDSLLGQVSVQANQISTPVSQAEAIKIKIAIALAAKVRGALVLTSEKLGSSAQNGNAVASVQGLIKKVDDIHVVLVGKLSASAGSSGSGQGEIDGGDKPSSDDLAQSITLAIKAILASANDISNSGNGGSADAKVKLSAALNALRALLDRVSQQANQIPTPVSQADAVRIKVATGLLLKLRGVLVGVRERITSSPDAAGENAESIATIDALIEQIDEIIVTLKGKVSANGNSGDENGNGNGGVNTIVQVKTALREILEAGKAIAAGNASEENNNQITEGISKINVILEDVAVQVDGISSPPSPADALKIKLTNVLLGKIKGALTLTGNILVAAPNAPENVDIISQLSKTINRVGEIQATLANKVNGGAAVDNGNSDGKNDDLCGTVSVTNAVKTAILLNKISILAQQIPNNPSVVQIGKAQAAIATLTAIRASLVAQLQQSVGESKSENSIKLFGALIGQVDATLGTLRAKVPSGSIGISALPAIAGAASISAVPDLLQQSVNSLSASIQVSTKN